VQWLLTILRWVLPATEVDGQRLDQDLRALLFLSNKRRSLETYEPPDARIRALKSQKLIPRPHVPMHAVTELHAAGLAMRRYQPTPKPSGDGLLYFHGGGFVVGGLESHDHLCRVLAKESGCELIAVDYRLAPEHPFPAAVNDALAAWQWFQNEPFARHFIGGDSAGGNLTAVVCQQTETKPDAQLLIYPATDAVTIRPSRTTFSDGFLYTGAMSNWFKKHYLPEGTDRNDERISPFYRTDVSDQPPAHVLVAGFDILHDEGVAYAEKLKQAGVPVTVQSEPSLIHGFTQVAGACPAALRAIQDAGRGLRNLRTEARATTKSTERNMA